jgi:hypothetical protein
MKVVDLWTILLLAVGSTLFRRVESGLPPSPLLSITQVTDNSISFAIEPTTSGITRHEILEATTSLKQLVITGGVADPARSSSYTMCTKRFQVYQNSFTRFNYCHIAFRSSSSHQSCYQISCMS